MSEWRTVAELVVLVPLLIALIRPLIQLNTVLTKLDTTVANLQEQLAEQRKAAKEAHAKLDQRIDVVATKTQENTEAIRLHEQRIDQLERGGGPA